jgi:hypothetical protein
MRRRAASRQRPVPCRREIQGFWCAGQTGKEQRVQVSYSEGVASHTGPESSVDIREGIGEGLTGERIGQALSRESLIIPDADVVEITEGNT